MAKTKTAKKKPPRKPKVGPATLEGSRNAKRLATAILEVLCGLRKPSDAGEVLEISVNRYYQLETRALQGLIAALEPLPRGRRATPEQQIAKLEVRIDELERELARSQSLLRCAQRTVGLRAPAKAAPNGKETKKKRRRRKPTVRAMRVIDALTDEQSSDPSLPAVADTND